MAQSLNSPTTLKRQAWFDSRLALRLFCEIAVLLLIQQQRFRGTQRRLLFENAADIDVFENLKADQ
jgi:hypothetical protein